MDDKQKQSNKLLFYFPMTGIVAGLVDKLKLVERIDARVPISKTHGAIVTHGQSIKAMIINGLGFTRHSAPIPSKLIIYLKNL